MTDQTSPPAIRLWTPQGFRDDEWIRADDAAALAGNGRFILPLAIFLAINPAERAGARERIGVELQPGEPVDALVPYLEQLSLVALAFPAFSDGRSFSKGELLRSRFGFKGSVRATGQVLVDQLPHMLRLGFDEFEVSNPVLLHRLEAGQVGGIDLYYQPATKAAIAGQGYSWRRTRHLT